MPVIHNFRATNRWKAFVLASFVASLIAVGAVEIRHWIGDSWLKDKPELITAFVTFIITFLVAFISYILMYFLFNYGEGMLAPPKNG